MTEIAEGDTHVDSSWTIDVHLTEEAWNKGLVTDVVDGLLSEPKEISPVWFYDAVGSDLFDQITRLEEYYPTETERTLLKTHAADVATISGADTLVELGSGTSDKTQVLLDALTEAGTLRRYVPFDVDETTLRTVASNLEVTRPDLAVHAVVGDFHQHISEIPRAGRRLVVFLGSTIGNFSADLRRRLLFDLDCTMEHDESLLLGIDLIKDESILHAAYDDAQGVTAAFNRNALSVMNKRLGADFDLDAFEHIARWDQDNGFVEMILRSTVDQTVTLDLVNETVHFAAGEEMRTEISTKFSVDAIVEELWQSGFVTQETWTADPGFLLLLAKPYC